MEQQQQQQQLKVSCTRSPGPQKNFQLQEQTEKRETLSVSRWERAISDGRQNFPPGLFHRPHLIKTLYLKFPKECSATMRKIWVCLLVLLASGSTNATCPKFISCESSETQNSCPEGTFYRENSKIHGCCPGCVRLKGEEESCKLPEECQPGLTCDSEKKRCVEDPSQACEHYKRFNGIWKKNKYWKPNCLPDGTYARKQCKGERMAGKCFCVNGMGDRIFGEEEWTKAENMTCACSRLAEDMRRRGLKTSLHCDRLGNFEPFQCDQKVCWCANPTTGIPYTVMLPLEMMISLPCYDRDAVGAQYHRQCDSVNHIKGLAESLLSNHGSTGITLPHQRCNFDGSYHRVQTVKEKSRCAYVDNSPLTEALESKGRNCNCAYDRHVAQLNQINFFADCLPNGNYKERQVWNDKIYCVDGDGFHYSNDPDDCKATLSHLPLADASRR